MTASITTRMPHGATNAAEWQTMGAAGLPDPSWAHVFHDDFDHYIAAEWAVSTVGSGTEALTAGDGGLLLLTTTPGASDSIQMQKPIAGFQLVAGKETFFKFTGTLGDANTEVFFAGLMAEASPPLSAADGLYITKAAGAGTLTLVSKIGGVSTTTAFPSSLSLTAGVQFEVGIRVAYNGDVYAYLNPTTGDNSIHATGANPQGRGAVVHLSAAAASLVTTAVLSPSFGIVNTAATAHTLTVDYVTAVRHR